MAAMSEAEASATRRVFEPETGRTRLVKANGEIVEEIVSREAQVAIRRRASTTRALPQQQPSSAAPVAAARATWTGREKFPSQHPWHGMK